MKYWIRIDNCEFGLRTFGPLSKEDIVRFYGNEVTSKTPCCAVGENQWHDIIEILPEILDPAQRELLKSAPEPTAPATNPKDDIHEKKLRKTLLYIACATLIAPFILWTAAYRWLVDPWAAILLGVISATSIIVAFILFQILFITRNRSKKRQAA